MAEETPDDSSAPVARPQPLGSMGDRDMDQHLRWQRQATTNKQAESYGRWLLWLLVVQLVLANGMMFLYAGLGVDWAVPNTVMQAWLAATVVQVVGLVWVVVHHLFPPPPSGDQI